MALPASAKGSTSYSVDALLLQRRDARRCTNVNTMGVVGIKISPAFLCHFKKQPATKPRQSATFRLPSTAAA